MSKQTEAIKLAIEVFDCNWHDEIVDTEWADKANNAITVLREALAEQPAREWVGLEQSDMPSGADPLFDDPRFIAGMVYAANKLIEKNT